MKINCVVPPYLGGSPCPNHPPKIVLPVLPEPQQPLPPVKP